MLNQTSSINLTTSTVQLPSEYMYCERFQDDENLLANYTATLTSITLSLLSCPFIILMNALVIVAIKTKRRLQTMYRILLACLAATDLFVGGVLQPTFIATQIFAIAGRSVTTYCNIDDVFKPLAFLSVLVTLFHLVLISVERLIALKHALRYNDIVTKPRLTVAVTFSWFIAGMYSLLRILASHLLPSFALVSLAICSLLVIAYSHISVYLVTRRHEKQIKTEQISGEAATKFLEEKKAWKTTSIIIVFVFLSFFPGVLFSSLHLSGQLPYQTRFIFRPVVVSSFMLNSLYNPIIYCWRSEEIRKAMISLLTKQNEN